MTTMYAIKIHAWGVLPLFKEYGIKIHHFVRVDNRCDFYLSDNNIEVPYIFLVALFLKTQCRPSIRVVGGRIVLRLVKE